MSNSRKVWKYLLLEHDSTLEIPSGAVLRLVGRDPMRGCPALWFEVDPEAETRKRRFLVHGTGHEIRGAQHVGSAICGAYVWHIYEEPTE